MKLKYMLQYINENARVKVIIHLDGTLFYSEHVCSYWMSQVENGDSILANKTVRRMFPDESSNVLCVEVESVL